MCEKNQHDFAVLSVSDKEVAKNFPTYEGDTIAYYNPASLFCRKCGYVCHVQANLHTEFKKKVW